MKQNRLRVEVTVAAPILTRSSTAGKIGVDAPVARTGDGRCYLPFSLVKGRIRQSWNELGLPAADEWFGSRRGGWTSSRARFRFSDFVERSAAAPAADSPFRGLHRIRIDRATGSVLDGQLQVIESPFAAGESVRFEGEITWFSPEEEVEETSRRLERAFRWTPSFGAGRTIGFGRVLGVECGYDAAAEDAAQSFATDDALFVMAIRLRDPLCLARRRIDDNVFASDDVIPGAVVRGVAATTLNRLLGRPASAEIVPGVADGSEWEALAANFNRIRLSHSFPAADQEQPRRPVVPPLSIVRDRDRTWWDVATCEGPGLIGGAAPDFAVDWKGAEAASLSAEFGWPKTESEIRVRTAIDRSTKRAAESQLFAFQMIQPEGLVWLGRADLSDVDPGVRAAVAGQLQRLFAFEPAAFGKTKARGRVTLTPDRSSAPVAPESDERTFIVTLQTPALLCDPALLDETSTREELSAAYAGAWDDISGGTLRLIRSFASQTLAGGYLLHRFQSAKPYAPFVLTDRGSVFVLEGQGDAAELLARWERTGIPLPQWARDTYGTSWKENPYLPEDGYGEIAVNLDCHRGKAPAGFRAVAVWEPPTIARGQSERVPRDITPSVAPERGEDLAVGSARTWTFTNRWRIEGRLTTTSDLHLGSGEITKRAELTREERGGAHGAPVEINAVAVDAMERAYLPGSSLKGALRAWLTGRADEDLIAAVFGDERDASAQAGKAEFLDAFSQDPAGDLGHVPHWDPRRRTGVVASVALDRRTRAARDQKLFYREVVPPGVRFDVAITGQDLSENEVALLLFALRGFNEEGSGAVTLGSETREGWGRFGWSAENVRTFNDPESWRGNWTEVTPHSDSAREALLQGITVAHPARPAISIDLAFDGPFLVNERSRTKSFRGKETGFPDHAPRVDRDGAVVLPASSFRGALRAQAERIVRTLGGKACRSTDPEEACSEPETLCVTCRLFGAPSWASPLSFAPFRLTNTPSQYRQELVAIDRFTGGVSGSAKFDVEAVWRPSFRGAITIADRKRLADDALGLLALVVSDLAEGDIPLGFGASKGFGVCRAACTWPSGLDPKACIDAFRRTVAADRVHPAPEPEEATVVRESSPPRAQAARRDGVFHNPYAFVPATRTRHDDLPIDAVATEQAGNVTHDSYAAGTFSGRIVCRLETETPMIVGNVHEKDKTGQRNEPTVVHPFRDPDTNGAAIPSTTLRGVISSVAEAASNSALRVLHDASLSYRCSEREENLPALGMIVEGGKRLQPLALPPLRDGWIPDRYRVMFGDFPVPPLKVYVNGYTPGPGETAILRRDSFLGRKNPDSFSADHTEYWYMSLPLPVRSGWTVRVAHAHMAGRYLLAQAPEPDSPEPIDQEAFDDLPPATKSGYVRGVLRVLGVTGRTTLSRRKHEIFVPLPSSPVRSYDAVAAVAEFERLAAERTDSDGTFPYEVKGSRRNDDPAAHGENIKLREGDIVFFEPSADGTTVQRLAISSIWRKGVDGTVHEFFREISSELLPMNPARAVVTPAEQLFGYVEAGSTKEVPKNRATALAGRIRFSMARRDAADAGTGDFLDAGVLQPLLSPKPPSPSFYFRPEQGTGPILKRALTKGAHVPQGRKMYLHGPAHWRREGAGDRFSSRATPVRQGCAFWFHVDVDNLSHRELGLLLYALRPASAFRHKVGMGKSLGLGTVRIDPVAILSIDRPSRYGSQPAGAPRYTEAWRDTSFGVEKWPARYAPEGAAVQTSVQLPDFFERYRAAYRSGIDPEIRVPLELIGDPANIVADVHTPHTEDVDAEGYQWFMRNESSAMQWLEPLDAQSAGLPLLSHADERIQTPRSGPAPQAKALLPRRAPEPLLRLTFDRATVVPCKNPERLETVAQTPDGTRVKAWASKDELTDYDTLVAKMKKKGHLTARVTVMKMPEGRFKIIQVEAL